MDEPPNMYPNLGDQTDFRLNQINEIKNYFIAEIRKSELMSKRLSKYVAFFDNIDKSFIVLSATSGRVSITSFASVIGVPVGIENASFSFTFWLTIAIVKKLLKTTLNKKKKFC